MELIIELKNNYIDITELRIKKNRVIIQKSARCKMPEGAYQNGIIINTNSVADALKGLLRESQIRTKKASICVNVMDITSKEIKIPKSPKRQVRGLLENELNKAEALKRGYMFDYVPVSMELENEENKKSFQIYSVYMIPEELVKNYQNTVKRAGLLLVGIMPVSYSMELLSELLELKSDKDLTVLVSAEESNINIMMSGNGIKNIYRSVELNEEENLEENMFIVSAVKQLKSFNNPEDHVIDKIAENVSKLVQFQMQSYPGKSVKRILLYGTCATKENFIENVSGRCGITAEKCILPKSSIVNADKDKYCGYNRIAVCCGGLIGLNKKLTFLNVPGYDTYVPLKDRIPLLAGIGCCLIASIIYSITYTENMKLEAESAQLKNKIAEIEMNAEYQRKEELERQLLELISYNKNVEICIEMLEQSDRLYSAVFSNVDELVPERIQIESYSYENHIAVFNCISTYQDGPADFAKIVSDAKIFNNVRYTGFSAFKDINGSTYYSFLLECSN